MTTDAPNAGHPAETIELTILMPCLNEAETLATCIRKARAFLDASGIDGEVLIADNGSTDGSQAIAATEGARVVHVPIRGYGAALLDGIDAARGRFVIMGDADDSYDFSALDPFVAALRAGADLVMGNRFRGGIEKGAMPASHRYLGNPVLSGLGRRFFHIGVGDFHCGLRGFRRDRIRALRLSTTGMEFASEMVVRSALAGYRIEEVPATLRPDGRSRPPHLRTWRDGWRHLRFLLLYSPRWLFLYPGIAMMAVGLAGVVALFPGPLRVGGVSLEINTFIASCLLLLIGLQAVTFAMIARRYATIRGLLPTPRSAVVDRAGPERLLAVGVVLFVLSLAGLLWCVWRWLDASLGPLPDPAVVRVTVLAFTGLAASAQLVLGAFLESLVELPQRSVPDGGDRPAAPDGDLATSAAEPPAA